MDEKGNAVATQGTRLLAQGAPLTLTDGRTVNVRYDMRALVLIEQHFGSTTAMAVELSDPTGKKFTALIHALACGLTHEGLDYDALLDLLHPSQVEEYDQAMEAAWDEAFPPAEEPDPNLAGETQSSPGSDGIGTPPSTSVAAMASSGV